jgi:hypothetical protein
MRNTAIGLVVIFGGWLTAIAQVVPQWKVVQVVQIVQQNSVVPVTTLFTPTDAGLYRVVAYMSTEGAKNGGWQMVMLWNDLTGLQAAFSTSANTGNGLKAWGSTQVVTFSPKPGNPVTYSVVEEGNVANRYNLTFTIEQLE